MRVVLVGEECSLRLCRFLTTAFTRPDGPRSVHELLSEVLRGTAVRDLQNVPSEHWSGNELRSPIVRSCRTTRERWLREGCANGIRSSTGASKREWGCIARMAERAHARSRCTARHIQHAPKVTLTTPLVRSEFWCVLHASATDLTAGAHMVLCGRCASRTGSQP